MPCERVARLTITVTIIEEALARALVAFHAGAEQTLADCSLDRGRGFAHRRDDRRAPALREGADWSR
jgi:hypothetical protein